MLGGKPETDALSIQQLREELATVESQIRPLQERREGLNRQIRKQESIDWIQSNGVTRDQIHRPEDFEQRFGHIKVFIDHLKTLDRPKRFVSWNGCLYFTRELMGGFMDPKCKGRLEDVPE